MKVPSLLGVLVAGGILLGCASGALTSPSGDTTPAAATITLRAGETATVTGTRLAIRFVRVNEDSRCPVDVTCVWAGDAAVELAVREEDGPWRTITLHTATERQRSATVGAHEIRLDRLDPPRVSEAPPKPEEYRATLVVSAAAVQRFVLDWLTAPVGTAII